MAGALTYSPKPTGGEGSKEMFFLPEGLEENLVQFSRGVGGQGVCVLPTPSNPPHPSGAEWSKRAPEGGCSELLMLIRDHGHDIPT